MQSIETIRKVNEEELSPSKRRAYYLERLRELGEKRKKLEVQYLSSVREIESESQRIHQELFKLKPPGKPTSGEDGTKGLILNGKQAFEEMVAKTGRVELVSSITIQSGVNHLCEDCGTLIPAGGSRQRNGWRVHPDPNSSLVQFIEEYLCGICSTARFGREAAATEGRRAQGGRG